MAKFVAIKSIKPTFTRCDYVFSKNWAVFEIIDADELGDDNAFGALEERRPAVVKTTSIMSVSDTGLPVWKPAERLMDNEAWFSAACRAARRDLCAASKITSEILEVIGGERDALIVRDAKEDEIEAILAGASDETIDSASKFKRMEAENADMKQRLAELEARFVMLTTNKKPAAPAADKATADKPAADKPAAKPTEVAAPPPAPEAKV